MSNRALLAQPIAQGADLQQDLKTCERILAAAETNATGWRFEIDY